MIELNLKLSPDTANHLLASLAGTINALGLLTQQIKQQGDAQMQPPADPNPEPQQEILDAHE